MTESQNRIFAEGIAQEVLCRVAYLPVPSRNHAGHKGNALLEFLFVFSFLLLAGFALWECYDCFHSQQVLSVAVRELGNAAFRYCPDADAGAKMNDCLEGVADTVLDYTNASGGVLPGTEVVLRVYRYNTGNPLSPLLEGNYASGSATSKYDAAVIAGDGVHPGLHSYIPEKEVIVIAEVFYARHTVLGLLPTDLYQTAVY